MSNNTVMKVPKGLYGSITKNQPKNNTSGTIAHNLALGLGTAVMPVHPKGTSAVKAGLRGKATNVYRGAVLAHRGKQAGGKL
jgi:hypothetical protein